MVHPPEITEVQIHLLVWSNQSLPEATIGRIDHAVGGNWIHLLIGKAMSGTERFNDAAGALEMHTRHGGKEMVFDLVVKSTEQVIPNRVRGDIPRAEYLTLQKREPGSLCPYRHPFMIRCNDRRQVEACYGTAAEEYTQPSPAKDGHQRDPQQHVEQQQCSLKAAARSAQAPERKERPFHPESKSEGQQR